LWWRRAGGGGAGRRRDRPRPRQPGGPHHRARRHHEPVIERSERGGRKPLGSSLQAVADPYTRRACLPGPPGGVAEWSKAAVLKTAERELRGFESLLLRQ